MLDAEFLKNNFQYIVFVAVLICVFAYILYTEVGRTSNEALLTEPKDVSEQSFANTSIGVEVSGAVHRPGVYFFEGPTRIFEVIQKAEGLSSDAAVRWISQKLNLADFVKDAQKIYIPFEWDYIDKTNSLKLEAIIYESEPHYATSLSDSTGTPQSSTSSTTSTPTTLNLNTATKDELIELPGVGEVTAQKIIDSRPYTSEDDFLTKTKIAKSTYVKFFEFVKETW